MSINWIKQLKATIDPHNATNMRVEFEFEDGELSAVILKVLPLSTGIIYRVTSEAFRPIQMELQTT